MSESLLLFDNPPFLPTRIGGFQAWYDTTSDDYLTLDGTAITQFIDRSGQGNDTPVQGTASARPTRALSQINGLQAATFDGGDTLELPSALYSIPNGNNTVFAVCKRNTETAQSNKIVGLSEVGSQRLLLDYGSSAGSAFYQSRTAAGNGASSSGTNTDFNLFTCYRDGSTQSISRNGSAESTIALGASEANCDAGHIGSLAGSSAFLTGAIAEILIFNRALTSTEITNINTYLSNKYNIGLA